MLLFPKTYNWPLRLIWEFVAFGSDSQWLQFYFFFDCHLPNGSEHNDELNVQNSIYSLHYQQSPALIQFASPAKLQATQL